MKVARSLRNAAVYADVRTADFPHAFVEAATNLGWLLVVVRVAATWQLRIVHVLRVGQRAILLFVALSLASAQENQAKQQALHGVSIL